MLGHSTEALARAQELGLGDVLERHDRFQAAELAYEEARTAFAAGRHDDALRGFAASRTLFDELGETRNAAAARLGAAWAGWNGASSLSPEEALTVYEALVVEAGALDEPELATRSRSGAAVAAARVGRDGAAELLEAAAVEAEAAEYAALAGSCWAELAELSSAPLERRARAARAALGLRADQVGVYAVYSVAVDAYNADQLQLAVDLAREVLPRAGDLTDAVTAVLGAAEEALEAL